MNHFLTATAFVALSTIAHAHDLVNSDKYPGLEGYEAGGYFRPIGVSGPELPNLDAMFAFIQKHSPEFGMLHPRAGQDRFTTDNIMPPVVRYLTNEQMEIFAGPGMGAAVAIYEEGYMYLNAEIDYSDDEDLSILLHELVHHVQWFSGENQDPHFSACPIHLENDAYRIQIEWMRDQEVSESWINMMKLNQQIQGGVICYADRP